MTEPRFTIGQSVFYRAGRVKEGPFRVSWLPDVLAEPNAPPEPPKIKE
jgi:hypothetical protein